MDDEKDDRIEELVRWATESVPADPTRFMLRAHPSDFLVMQGDNLDVSARRLRWRRFEVEWDESYGPTRAIEKPTGRVHSIAPARAAVKDWASGVTEGEVDSLP